jgi:hypothetical protein
MKKDGLQRMLEFLELLRSKGIHFRIERQSPEALMVTFTLTGVCIEVDFFVNEVSFSYFRRSGADETDEKALYDLIARHWGD